MYWIGWHTIMDWRYYQNKRGLYTWGIRPSCTSSWREWNKVMTANRYVNKARSHVRLTRKWITLREHRQSHERWLKSSILTRFEISTQRANWIYEAIVGNKWKGCPICRWSSIKNAKVWVSIDIAWILKSVLGKLKSIDASPPWVGRRRIISQEYYWKDGGWVNCR